jgi:hypothetical protein
MQPSHDSQFGPSATSDLQKGITMKNSPRCSVCRRLTLAVPVSLCGARGHAPGGRGITPLPPQRNRYRSVPTCSPVAGHG